MSWNPSLELPVWSSAFGRLSAPPAKAGSANKLVSATLGLALAVAILSAPSVSGQSIVTDCTQSALQAAITASNSVILACDGVIELTNTIVITRNTRLDASGHQIVISGPTETNGIRLFQVNTGVVFTVVNLTLANGSSTHGAAIYNNRGFLNITGCVFSNNVTQGANGLDGSRGKDSEFGRGSNGRRPTAAAVLSAAPFSTFAALPSSTAAPSSLTPRSAATAAWEAVAANG